MLILIAGITGNIGQQAAQAGLLRNHQIRGLGRSPAKLAPNLHTRLESFITSQTYYDISALEAAVQDVDAVICAYAGMPELALEGQLLLLRAAERAGVTRFLAASWNYDWRRIDFKDEEVYDAYLAFHAHVEISSSIKTCHLLTGILAEVFFGTHPEQGFTPADDGIWDPNGEVKKIDVYGTGDEDWCFTTEADAGAFAVEVATSNDAPQGGFVTLYSFRTSLNGLVDTYKKLRPDVDVEINMKGSIQDLETKAIAAKEKYGRREWWKYHRLFFQPFTLTGRWDLGKPEFDTFPGVKPTALESFLEDHPDV